MSECPQACSLFMSHYEWTNPHWVRCSDVTTDVNHGGQGGTVPSKVLTGGSSVDCPLKLKLLRDTAGSCIMRSQKEYVTYYTFESAIVKLKFPLGIMTSSGSRGVRTPSLNH